MKLPEEVIKTLMEYVDDPSTILEPNGLLNEISRRLIEAGLETEMADHLGYDKHSIEGNNSGNSRNGSYNKTVSTKSGDIDISVPRDRNGKFEPKIIPKGSSRFNGFDDLIMSLYSRGLSTREIESHIKEIYQVDLSPTMVSKITSAVSEDVEEWRNRPLEAIYPIIFMDAIHIFIKTDTGTVKKAVNIVLGINMEGKKEVLSIHISENEGAKYWLMVLNNLLNRGVKDVLIFCIDGLKGFPEAIEATFPEAIVQKCIVHIIRNSLKNVSHKEKKEVATDLKPIYQAKTESEAKEHLERFKEKYKETYPTIAMIWERNWEYIIPMFRFPYYIRKIIYTTNAIESMNWSLRKQVKNKGAYPSDQSACKVVYLAIKRLETKWTRPISNWGKALNQFAIQFPDRVPVPE